MRAGIVIAVLFAISPASGFAQTQPDRQLLADIRAIRAIDNHSHVTAAAPVVLDEARMRNPLGTAAFPRGYPVRLRLDNREWIGAWRALYGATVTGMTANETGAVLRAKQKIAQQHGDEWPAWVLDKVGIETIFVNNSKLAPGQNAPRFQWVPNANSLLFPFGGIDADPEVGKTGIPPTLDAYMRDVIGSTLARWRSQGALAIKLSIAYSRPLDFAAVSKEDAARIYGAAAAREGAPPDAASYKMLQDYLFRALARAAGSAGLVVHIHTGIGADPYFALAGGNPLLLEPALNDPELRATTFVLIHGAWPFDRQAGAMLMKPNVYADFSAQTFLRSARALSETLRAWLEWYPEKVLFGSDAYTEPDTPLAGWEEKLWLSNDTAREALAIALTGMMNDGDITRERALELARLVLRENALTLYGAGLQSKKVTSP